MASQRPSALKSASLTLGMSASQHPDLLSRLGIRQARASSSKSVSGEVAGRPG